MEIGRTSGNLAIMLGLTLGASAQERNAPVFRSTTNLVIITATVTGDGRPVQGLSKQACTITEEGVPQTVSVFDTEDLPVSIGLLVDTSGSMSDKLEDVQDALRHGVPPLVRAVLANSAECAPLRAGMSRRSPRHRRRRAPTELPHMTPHRAGPQHVHGATTPIH